jgi:hypothetical protein
VTTVYISIGNSDDKITQREWSMFVQGALGAVGQATTQIHGVWFSAPDSEFQNACVCAEIDDSADEKILKERLAQLARLYSQDSVAWAVADTEFIRSCRAAHIRTSA